MKFGLTGVITLLNAKCVVIESTVRYSTYQTSFGQGGRATYINTVRDFLPGRKSNVNLAYEHGQSQMLGTQRSLRCGAC